MNKILNSEVRKFKEWCCGKDLINDYLCGDTFNKTTKFICDDCLYKLTVRKTKIQSIRKEMIKLKANNSLSEKALYLGYRQMQESLLEEIERLENGR